MGNCLFFLKETEAESVQRVRVHWEKIYDQKKIFTEAIYKKIAHGSLPWQYVRQILIIYIQTFQVHQKLIWTSPLFFV